MCMLICAFGVAYSIVFLRFSHCDLIVFGDKFCHFVVILAASWKAYFCKCNTKKDQLRGNREVDQRHKIILFSLRICNGTIPLPPKSETIVYGCTARIVSDLVENRRQVFSQKEKLNRFWWLQLFPECHQTN